MKRSDCLMFPCGGQTYYAWTDLSPEDLHAIEGVKAAVKLGDGHVRRCLVTLDAGADADAVLAAIRERDAKQIK